MVDRHDDELAERRASGGRPKLPADAGGAVSGAPGAAGALPLQWPEADAGGDEPGPPGEVGGGAPGSAEPSATVDITERAGRDDFAVWSGVLRRRPAEAARLTSHPSAAGERLSAAAEPRRPEPEDDEFARALLERGGRRNRGRGDHDDRDRRKPAPDAPPNVSRLRPLVPESDGPAGPSGFGADLVQRVVTGAAVAAACLLTFNAGRGPAAGLVAIIVGLAVLELGAALRPYRPAVVIALAGSVGLVVGAYTSGEGAFPLVTALVVVTSLLWYLAQVVRSRPALGIATTLLVFGYVGVLGGFAGLLLGFRNGVGMLIGLAICTVSYDICGYAAGRRFGRRRLTAISPNKTVEGLVAGMAGSILLSVLIVGTIAPWDRLSALALGAVVAVLAPLGDLCESMLKRDLGVKDLGGLLPGHGGVLDRFDAILFSLPAVYYLVRVLELA